MTLDGGRELTVDTDIAADINLSKYKFYVG
jgi:hypothetical protein